MTRKIFSTALTSASLLAAFGSTAYAGIPDNFAAIDTNADGQVTYKEYAKSAKGKTTTAAAQEFIKISNGNTVFTEADLMTAIAMQGQASNGLIVNTSSQGLLSTPSIVVGSSSTEADVPRWSDGTPVDLDAVTRSATTGVGAQTDTQYSSESSGAYIAPTTTTNTVIEPQDRILKDLSSTTNPQMEVWDETGEASGAHSTPAPVVTTTTETDITVRSGVDADTQDAVEAMQMKKEELNEIRSDMKTTVETPELKIEVEPQPEK